MNRLIVCFSDMKPDYISLFLQRKAKKDVNKIYRALQMMKIHNEKRGVKRKLEAAFNEVGDKRCDMEVEIAYEADRDWETG